MDPPTLTGRAGTQWGVPVGNHESLLWEYLSCWSAYSLTWKFTEWQFIFPGQASGQKYPEPSNSAQDITATTSLCLIMEIGLQSEQSVRSWCLWGWGNSSVDTAAVFCDTWACSGTVSTRGCPPTPSSFSTAPTQPPNAGIQLREAAGLTHKPWHCTKGLTVWGETQTSQNVILNRGTQCTFYLHCSTAHYTDPR